METLGMTNPHVAFVEGNLKGGVACALGPKTLVVGPNGSGKSAVANTIELALTGRVSDILGRRDVAKEVELMALAPERKGELLAAVELSNGLRATWRAGGKGGKKAKHSIPECVEVEYALPLRPVHEAIVGSVETARKFFLQYAVGAVNDKDVLDRIPASLHPYYKRATMQSTLSTSSAVDRLLAALEKAKKEARAAKDRAKASEAVSNDSANGLAPLPTEAEEKGLRDALREAEKKLDAAKKALAGAEATATARAALADATALVTVKRMAEQQAMEAKVAADTALATIPVPPTLDPQVIATANAIKAHADTNMQDCLVCGAHPATGTFAARLELLQKYVADVQAASTAYNTAANGATLAAAALQKAVDERAKAETALTVLQEASGADVGTLPTEETVTLAEQEVSRLREAMRKIDVLRAAWSASQKARESAGEATTEAGEWKKLAEACVEAVAKLLDAGVTGFVSRVQRWLPPSDQFALTLRDGDRAVFQFGLNRAGVVHTALSGAEWARVTAALAGACRGPQEKVSVVIPEERAYDPHTLSLVLAAFGELDSQVVLASPVMPNIVPAGWTVVNTAADEHRSGNPTPRVVPTVSAEERKANEEANLREFHAATAPVEDVFEEPVALISEEAVAATPVKTIPLFS